MLFSENALIHSKQTSFTILLFVALICGGCGGGASLTENIDANVAPIITTSTALSVLENNTTVTSISANDDNGDALYYSIISGDDAALFTINNLSGALSFNNEANYEDPLDNNSDNIYEIVIAVSDGELSSSLPITISVNDELRTKLWDKQFGGTSHEYCHGVIASNDGHFFIAGISASDADGNKTQDGRGGYDYWVVKVDNQGNKIWDKRFGGSGSEYLNQIIHSRDGNIFLAGYTRSEASYDVSDVSRGNRDFWLVKIDHDGNAIWDKRFGGSGFDDCAAISEDTDGSIVLAGCSNSGISGDKSEASRGSYDYWTIKLDSDGNKIWDKRFGGSSNDCCLTIHINSDRSIIFGGYSASGNDGDRSQSSRGSHDCWLVKVDSDGNKIWDKRFGTGYADYCRAMISNNDGGVLFISGNGAGINGDRTVASRGGHDIWLVNVDSNGNKIWDKRFGGAGNDSGWSLIHDNDGGFVLGGYSDSDMGGDKSEDTRGQSDYWILKIDSLGNKIWDKRFGGLSSDQPYSGTIVANNNDGFLLVGHSYSNTGGDKSEDLYGSQDIWVVNYGEGTELLPAGVRAPTGVTQYKNTYILKYPTAIFIAGNLKK